MGGRLSFLAADLGAESGRVMLGRFDGERLVLEEIHRFDSRPVRLPDGLHTDVLRIWSEIQDGFSAARRAGDDAVSLGVDTWGVDFALLDREGSLLGEPYHYRDSLGSGILERAFARVPRAEVFAATGNQFLEFNTLFQLLRLRERGSAALRAADRLLMMPDLFSYWLCGRQAAELTIASTSQCFDPRRRAWANELLSRFDLDPGLFREIVEPGTNLGELRPQVAEETGLGRLPVIAVGGHDTALAVAAVPARGPDFAYISSGTWSLLGAELEAPCFAEAALAANFTNEGGVFGTTRLLKNLAGLWLVQECRRQWAREGDETPYSGLEQAAAAAPAYRSLVDVDAPEFAAAGEMPARIGAYCRRTGQAEPRTKGELVRTALDSLALKYRYVLAQLEAIVGRRLEPLHIVGGGSRNRLLCQLAADATGRRVVAGPAEATAVGNVLMQALALGRLASLAEARELVRRSFEVVELAPRRDPAVDDAFGRLLELVER